MLLLGGRAMLENEYQASLKKKIKTLLPGCIVLKNDPNYIQGIPDLVVFYKNHYGFLEVKKSESASHRPNQDYYVTMINHMSFAAFIYPENEEEILNDLQRALQS